MIVCITLMESTNIWLLFCWHCYVDYRKSMSCEVNIRSDEQFNGVCCFCCSCWCCRCVDFVKPLTAASSKSSNPNAYSTSLYQCGKKWNNVRCAVRSTYKAPVQDMTILPRVMTAPEQKGRTMDFQMLVDMALRDGFLLLLIENKKREYERWID